MAFIPQQCIPEHRSAWQKLSDLSNHSMPCVVSFLVACLTLKVEEPRVPYSTPHTYSYILTYIPLSNIFFRQRHRRQEEIVTAPIKWPRDQPGPRNAAQTSH